MTTPAGGAGAGYGPGAGSWAGSAYGSAPGAVPGSAAGGMSNATSAPGSAAGAGTAAGGVGAAGAVGAAGQAGRVGAAGRPAARSGAGAAGGSGAARGGATSSAPRRAKPTRPPRLASLQVRRIDPWTALKISLVVSIVMFFVWMIAIGVLYLSLDAMNVWSKINDTYTTLVVAPDSTTTPTPLITPGTVFGVTAVIGAVNIVLFTALSAIAAFVYNAAAGMVGGVEVTLGEQE